jgi:WD40 repeat protein
VAISPDGRLIASQGFGARDETTKVWRASDGALLHSTISAPVRDGQPEVLAFSPDSTLLVRSGENDRLLQVLDAERGTVLRSIDLRPNAPPDVHEDATGLAFSPDGQSLAVTGRLIGMGESAVVDTFRVADGAPLASFLHPTHEDATGGAFSPDGTRLAANTDLFGSDTFPLTTVTLYRTSDRARLWTSDSLWPAGLGGIVRDAPAFSPDGARLAAPNRERGVRVWSSADGALLAELAAPTASGVAFSPAGDRLVVATETGIRLYRTDDWSLDGELPGAFRSVATSATGPRLLAGALVGTVRLWCDDSGP